MASNINPFNIDGTYPVAGQDNDSQGFRDNFTNIRNNLSYAKTELEDLQAKVVLKSALIGTTLDNNFAGAPITGAFLTGVSETLKNLGVLSSDVTINFALGNVYKVETSGEITLSFTGWPQEPNIYSRVRVWLNITDPAHTVAVPDVTAGGDQIAGFDTVNRIITFDTAGDYILEFTTANGSDVTIFEVSRNFTTFRGNDFYYDPSISNTFSIGYDSSTLPSALTNWEFDQNKVSSFGAINSVAVGNLSLASTADYSIDTGFVGGYTITAARGNLSANTFQVSNGADNAVKSNDLLGRVNTVAFTGDSSANAFAQTTAINFYATGSDTTNGLGANIAFYTKRDGGSITQAMSLENDQSMRLNGSLVLKNGAPAGSSSTGVAGQVAYDSGYLYVCTSTNTWKRVALNLTSW